MGVFIGIEFNDHSMAIVHKSWLTPRKKHTYWPPYKKQKQFLQALRKGEEPGEKWDLHEVVRRFFHEDDYSKACQKLKLAEEQSNIQSDDGTTNNKRKRYPPKRLSSSDEEDILSYERGELGPSVSRRISVEENPEPNTSTSVISVDRAGSIGNKVIQDSILKILGQIKEQNNEILSLVRENRSNSNTLPPGALPANFSVKLPINCQEDLEQLENFLTTDSELHALTLYLSGFGGRDLANTTNRILKHIFRNYLATFYSFFGKRANKQPFRALRLKIAVIDAVKTKLTETTQKDVGDCMKLWLKHSPQRLKNEKKSTLLDTDSAISDDEPNYAIINTLKKDSSVDEIIDISSNSVDLKNNSKNVPLTMKLKQWVVNRNIPYGAATELLHILSKYHSELPLDCRTLLKTSTPLHIKYFENGGEFCYLGILHNLKRIVSQNKGSTVENKLKISFNVDGLPLFKSSTIQLSPILGLVKNFNNSPFAIALFCGSHKPAPLSQFFETFIEELQMLLECGFNIDEHKYSVEIDSFIFDARARAYIKCVKSHSGYSSCDKCTISGEYLNRSVVFRGTAPKRTDL
ncbi:unnamed protein product [Brassicogethes aeneus]|uniref:DUF4806 domain-containing protein n=1 Tax=Brassicogethes aeneus TaxID=1431903 RepID=A0A9P0B6X6_BRAAE|nr:unnamed protein product [Brassicogethes aeneus]